MRRERKEHKLEKKLPKSLHSNLTEKEVFKESVLSDNQMKEQEIKNLLKK